MKDLKAQIIQELMEIGQFVVTDMYTDWNWEEKTGMILAVLCNETIAEKSDWPKPIDDPGFNKAICEFCRKAQKIPVQVEAFWLNNRTLLIKRSDIFIHVEKDGYIVLILKSEDSDRTTKAPF